MSNENSSPYSLLLETYNLIVECNSSLEPLVDVSLTKKKKQTLLKTLNLLSSTSPLLYDRLSLFYRAFLEAEKKNPDPKLLRVITPTLLDTLEDDLAQKIQWENSKRNSKRSL